MRVLFLTWRRIWQPTPVFLPGESLGRGAWWAAVYGVAQSWTRLKWLSSSSSSSWLAGGCPDMTSHSFSWAPGCLSWGCWCYQNRTPWLWPHLTLITPWMHHLYTETQRGLGLNMYFKEHKTLYILIKTLNIKFESFSFFLPPQSIKERNKKISSDPDAFSGNCFQTFKEKLLPMSHNIFHNIGKRKNIPTWFMRSA